MFFREKTSKTPVLQLVKNKRTASGSKQKIIASHQKGDYSHCSTIRRLVSSHNYSTIQLPEVKGPIINVRKPGIPEGIHIGIYQKLGVPYENLPVTKTMA